MANTDVVEKQPLTEDYLKKMDAYWRATNYLGAAQLYLLDNPLLREPLTMEHVKKKIRKLYRYPAWRVQYKKTVLIDGISTVYRQSLPRILFPTSAYFPGLATHLKLPRFSGLLFPARMPQFLRPPAANGSTAFFFP